MSMQNAIPIHAASTPHMASLSGRSFSVVSSSTRMIRCAVPPNPPYPGPIMAPSRPLKRFSTVRDCYELDTYYRLWLETPLKRFRRFLNHNR